MQNMPQYTINRGDEYNTKNPPLNKFYDSGRCVQTRNKISKKYIFTFLMKRHLLFSHAISCNNYLVHIAENILAVERAFKLH